MGANMLVILLSTLVTLLVTHDIKQLLRSKKDFLLHISSKVGDGTALKEETFHLGCTML